MTQPEPIPPIGTQISRLAEQSPDDPAVTCEGRTITRAELDASTNRLARAYARRGVGSGDYVTIVLPNSIEWVQAAVACWKIGAVPQPLSPRLPEPELEGLLELKPRALLVGRTDPRGEIPSIPAGFTPAESDAALPEAVSPCWKSMASGGSTGRPKLIEAGGDSRIPPTVGYPLGAREGDTTLVSVPYALVQTTDNSTLGEPAVQAFLRERIAAYKVPRAVEFVDTPLRDDAGKARRSAVRADVITRLQARQHC